MPMAHPNGTASSGVQHGDSLTLPRAVEAACDRYAERTAIEDGELSLRFDELWGRALDAARAFVASGLKPGERVAIWAPNIWEWIVAAIGLEAVGGVLVPINTRFKGTEALHVLSKSRARLLLTVEEFLGQHYLELLQQAGPLPPELERIVLLRGASKGAVSFADFLARKAEIEPERVAERIARVRPDDPLDILFTSGTTGLPKGVVTTHAQNLSVFLSWSEIIGLRPGDRYLIINPFFHAFGYKAGWLSAILRGATILPHAVFDVARVFERIARERVSVLPGPPALYQSLLAHPELGRADLSSLRLAVTGAAVIPVTLIERMRRELSFETVITGYGLTESTGVVTMCRKDDDAETIAKTSGRAIPGVEVRCVDEHGDEKPRGEPGEVVVRGYNVMQGYFEDPAASREAIDEQGWLKTGDIGVMNERGYLTITDRKKDMFIVGGFNCYPAEIESLMLRHPEIAQVAVIGVPDERLGEVGLAFVVLAPGARATTESISLFCREQMAN
jgi:acyl-CoA synthetase (AMP-forming)/AMP-acid ligase II